MHIGRSFTLVVSAPVLLLTLALSACGDGCPEPQFAEPTIADGIQGPEGGGETYVVVAWPATAGDEIPDDYYAMMQADELPPSVRSAENTGPRELTVTFSTGANVRTTPTELDIELRMDDTQNWVDCSHPGNADTYFVVLHLSFDGRGGVVASFADVTASLGACAASGPERPRASSWWLVPLAFGYLWRRRQRTLLRSNS